MYGRTLDFDYAEQFAEDRELRLHPGDFVPGTICVVRMSVRNADFFGIEYGGIITEVSPEVVIASRRHSTNKQWYLPYVQIRSDGMLMSYPLAEHYSREVMISRIRSIHFPYVPAQPSHPFGYVLGEMAAIEPVCEEIAIESRDDELVEAV